MSHSEVKEIAVAFGETKNLIGIWSSPTSCQAARPAVLLLNAGFVHRIGPNRLHVSLARRLAKIGYPALRFDFSGIGDSLASSANIPHAERELAETKAAMDWITTCHGNRRFIPFGICSGADFAVELAERDERVSGAALVNGGLIGSRELPILLKQAKMKNLARGYRKRIFTAKSWARLLRGKSDFKAIRSTLKSALLGLSTSSEEGVADIESEKQLDKLLVKKIQLLVILSEGSLARDLISLKYGTRLESESGVQLKYFENTDHIFTPLSAQARMIETVVAWIRNVDSRL